MDSPQYQEHLYHLITRVQDALAEARSGHDTDSVVRAARVDGLLRIQESLERKLADHEAETHVVEPTVVTSVTTPAPFDEGLSLEEKHYKFKALGEEISQISGQLPQLRTDLTIAAFHASADPFELESKRIQIDALVLQIAQWIEQRDYLARQISRLEA
ncbi:MAG TPA: hypothetical protein VNL71_11885 [Chloroflexota bacterium]|nr:hypothetical protein [Chloroflexota bacterium]